MGHSHTILARIIHWTFIPLYVYGIVKQVDDISQLEDRSLLMFEVLFATIFLVIVVLRFGYMRRFDTFLGASESVPIVHTLLAKTIHRLMYLSLIMLPLTGLMIAGLFVQGTVEGLQQNIALSLHEFAASLSYVLIIIHILAAIYSRIKGDGVWSSMVPILKEDGPTSNEMMKRISAIEHDIYVRVEEFFSAKK